MSAEVGAGGVRLRPARPDDAPALAPVFRAAIAARAAAAYSPAQVAAWLRGAADPEAFGRRLLQAWRASVACQGGRVVGFVTLERAPEAPEARLAMLYVHPAVQGQGVGGRLVAAALTEARAAGVGAVVTEASAFSEPVFLRAGFRVTHREVVVRGEVSFERAVMAWAPDGP